MTGLIRSETGKGVCRVNWDKYKGAFDIFRDTQAVIAEKGNYNSLWNTYDISELGTVIGNLQDYSGGLAEKDYGLAVECQKKFYCADNDVLKVGRYLKIGTQNYRIEHKAEGKLGLTLLLKECELNGKCERNT